MLCKRVNFRESTFKIEYSMLMRKIHKLWQSKKNNIEQKAKKKNENKRSFEM